jgi:predicted ribosome quality control (RQC) complex YloA/Tae2 family protein
MAFDGITISSIVNELNDTINGGRLYKISQPEADEIMLTIKTQSGQYRLVLSANASLPLAYLTDDNKPSPATAPNFCMLLRKHLNNGRIISITQPKFERVIDIEAEHLNELGDLCRKHIIAEFMGKHSNIILCDDNNTILDSIKHISAQKAQSGKFYLEDLISFLILLTRLIRLKLTESILTKQYLQSLYLLSRRCFQAIQE